MSPTQPKSTASSSLSSRTPAEDGIAYETSVYKRGLDFERPALTFDSTQWEDLACARLSADSKAYVYGSAGRRETLEKNRSAFQKWSFVPRRLVKYDGFPNLQTTLFGEPLAAPIALAPVGVLRIFNPDGEIAATRAAARQALPYILSTASSSSTEEVADANKKAGGGGGGGGGKEAQQTWYQLYWPSRAHDNITISLLRRAQEAGYSVLFVTLDTYVLGWRPEDMDNGYNPFLRADRTGVELGMTDPVFRRQFKEKHGVEVEQKMDAAAPEWMRVIFPGENHRWEDIEFLKQHWKGPIVLKGIQSIADAKRAVDVGVQGIVVSNHGGRQVDGGTASLGVLPHVVDAVKEYLTQKKQQQQSEDDFKILFDSGIQSGVDVAKALALGADCVLVGRPYVYGLALGGEKGVEHVLKSLVGELELTLHLSGIESVGKEHLNRACLVREDALFEGVKGVGLR